MSLLKHDKSPSEMKYFIRNAGWLGFLFILLSFASPKAALATGITTKISFKISDKGISGKVTDETTGGGLSGASITVKGAGTSTISDAQGNYSIKVSDENAVLVFTFVGYASQEIAVKGKTTINVALKSATADLAQVVVMGYGTQSKKDVTGAVKSIKSESFNRGIITGVEQLLQGKAAGVNVTSSTGEPGAAIGITVRGPGGLRGTSPLFVVDGVPNGTYSPDDIESIDVLKDASATAIYGSRGANGVILITTKKGKAGVGKINFNTSWGISTLAKALPIFSTEEYKKQVVAAGGILVDKGGNTDWQKEITRSANTQNHNLNLSGGADKLTYYASFGIQNQEGIIKYNDLNRYSGHFNVTQKFLEDRLTVEANINVLSTTNTRPPINSVIANAISNNPTYPAYDAAGNPAMYLDIENPMLTFKLSQDMRKGNNVGGNITSSFRIAKGLIYKLNYGVNNNNSTVDIQNLPNLVPLQLGGLATYYNTSRTNLIENYLTYTMTSGDHSLSAMAGHSYEKGFFQGRNYSIDRFPISPVEPQYNPSLGQELTLAANKPGGYAFINELQSFFGRVNYQYKNKYLATANIRSDGSSKFGKNNRYGTFPSFSLGWKASEEKFMKNSIFSNLKVRAGWGQTGNQEIPPKITQALYTSAISSSATYPLSETGAYSAGTVFSRLANPNIQWEMSSQTNVGIDFGLFKGKLTGSIDVFKKVSSNILLEVVPADPIQPAGSFWTNVKDMNITNKGFEAELDYKIKTGKGFNYSIGGNMTIMSNLVTNSPYSLITTGGASGSGLSTATINGYVNNQPIGTIFLKEFIGLDAAGVSKFKDQNGDGIISDKDRIAIGSALPTLLYSFYGTMAYKDFDFIVNFNGVSGNKLYDNTSNGYFYKLKLSKGNNTTIDAINTPGESTSNAASVSSRYVKDGAYLRLNNLSLGYTFNTKNIGVSRWITAMRLSVTGQNLFVITKYNGFDPEVNTDRSSGGIASFGIDYLTYPKARSVIFGLNVSF
jgi:iron complex outermembrane receptor protein